MAEFEDATSGHEDADFVAPETGTVDSTPQQDIDPLVRYEQVDQEGKEVVLRNAHAYLFDRESLKDKESPFRESTGQKASRVVKKYWNVFIGSAGSGFGKKWGNQDPTKYELSPLERAFREGTDEKLFDEVTKKELEKGPNGVDRLRLQQNAIFREAFELREKAIRLIDEKRRGTDWPREGEIDAELNLAYLKLMLLAHTRSFEAQITTETNVKRGPVDRKVARGEDEPEADWRQRAQTTKEEVKLAGVSRVFNVGAQNGVDTAPRRSDATEWHHEWISKVSSDEAKYGVAAGYDKPIKTEAELTRENLEGLSSERNFITTVADVLSLVPPNILEERYGIRVNVQKPEEVKKVAFQKGKKTVTRPHTKSREITIHLPDQSGGSFVHLSVEAKGFLQEKDGKLSVSSRPTSMEKMKDEEYLALLASVVKHQGNSPQRFPTLLFANTSPAEILDGQALRQLEYQYAQILSDFPDLNARAEQAAERERRLEEQRIAAETARQRQTIVIEDE
jgi:hypothetical protein